MLITALADSLLIDAHCHRAATQGISIVSVDMSELDGSAAVPALAFGGDGTIGPAPLTAGLPSGAIRSQSDKAHALTDSGRAVFNDLTDYDPQISGYFSLGIHPWLLDRQAPEPALARLERLAEHPRILAIGECGLDKCIAAPMPRQIEVFGRQIAIAENLGKPVIVHCVRAYAELLQLRKRLKPRQDWIVHGFCGKPTLARQLTDAGCCLSFGAAVLDRPYPAGAALQAAPLAQVFLETDAAADVQIDAIYRVAATMLGLEEAALKRQMVINFKRVFLHV